MARNFNASPQQRDFLDWVEQDEGSCLLEAVAGAGKTTTLVEASALTKGQGFFGAFNKKIATEIQDKLSAKGIEPKRIRASTMHAAGLSGFRYRNQNAQIDENKESKLWNRRLNPGMTEDDKKAIEDLRSPVLKLVSLAKQRAVGVVCPLDQFTAWRDIVDHFGLDLEMPEGVSVEQYIAHAQEVLVESNKQVSEVISFDDMIYAPLITNTRMYQLDWVIVDEAQDTNPARRELAARMLKRGGRFVAVGDRAQALYSFTGADVNSLDLIAAKFNCKKLPLTVSYRCPKAVVARARQYVSHIESHPDAPMGIVRSIDAKDLIAQDLKASDVILCRFNRPLVDLALRLAASRIPCRIEGRDIGKGLVALINKMKVVTLPTLVPKLRVWGDNEAAKLKKKNAHAAAESVKDRVESIVALAMYLSEKGQNTTDDLCKLIMEMFGDSDSGSQDRLVLSSVHKAKGREWDRVFLYGSNEYMPSRNVKMPWEYEVENFIQYVAVTRSKYELVDVFV